MKQSGYTRPLTGFLLLSALCMAWIWLEPEIRYLVWDYTAKTFDVLSRRLFLFADYLCYGLLLAGRSQLNRRLSASLWWINGLCLIGALALYFMQFDENVYPFLPLALAAQCLVDSIAALRRRRLTPYTNPSRDFREGFRLQCCHLAVVETPGVPFETEPALCRQSFRPAGQPPIPDAGLALPQRPPEEFCQPDGLPSLRQPGE